MVTLMETRFSVYFLQFHRVRSSTLCTVRSALVREYCLIGHPNVGQKHLCSRSFRLKIIAAPVNSEMSPRCESLFFLVARVPSNYLCYSISCLCVFRIRDDDSEGEKIILEQITIFFFSSSSLSKF